MIFSQKDSRERQSPPQAAHGSIDIIMPGCHKASGLARLAGRWGISPMQCAAFGDGGNDIEMLRYCGHSYAMENASPDVKKAAKTHLSFNSGASLCVESLQIPSGAALMSRLDLLLGSRGHNVSALVSAARSHVNDVVRIPNHIQVMLNHQNRGPPFQ